jgi:beta-phosphoglucomutase-like phosphatase (HAD superfamily)
MIKVIIFDLDGTIIDSEALSLQAILDCSQKWGVPITREEAGSVVGRKWEEAFDILFSKHQIPVSREVATHQVILRFQEIVRKDVVFVPLVKEAILDFSRHFRLALVSGSHRADVLWALQKLGVDHLFEVIYGAEDYPRSKPAPDGYMKALATMEVMAEEAVVFEDSVPGLMSAHAAGIRSVAIGCTNHFKHDQSLAQERIHDYTGVDAAWVKAKFR